MRLQTVVRRLHLPVVKYIGVATFKHQVAFFLEPAGLQETLFLTISKLGQSWYSSTRREKEMDDAEIGDVSVYIELQEAGIISCVSRIVCLSHHNQHHLHRLLYH